MPGVVRVRVDVLERMAEEARRNAGLECCGLLGGREGLIFAIFPAPNALASATSFEIAPRELFRLFRQMRAAGLELLGIYHSHPAGGNAPSARDLEGAFYPEVTYFIVSLQPGVPKSIRAFSIRDGSASELMIEPAIQAE